MENTKEQKNIIKCPYCGWEYLPGEILYPENVVGQPINIVKDSLGHIIYKEYIKNKELETTETFTCEHCDKEFLVDIEMSFKTREQIPELNFTETTVSLF